MSPGSSFKTFRLTTLYCEPVEAKRSIALKKPLGLSKVWALFLPHLHPLSLCKWKCACWKWNVNLFKIVALFFSPSWLSYTWEENLFFHITGVGNRNVSSLPFLHLQSFCNHCLFYSGTFDYVVYAIIVKNPCCLRHWRFCLYCRGNVAQLMSRSNSSSKPYGFFSTCNYLVGR